MAMKTILEAIKKHRGKFSNQDVEQIRLALTSKMADDPRRKVTAVDAPTYQEYRAAIKKLKLKRSETVWLREKTHQQFNIIKTITYP